MGDLAFRFNMLVRHPFLTEYETTRRRAGDTRSELEAGIARSAISIPDREDAIEKRLAQGLFPITWRGMLCTGQVPSLPESEI
jgi:hypothetical protein